MLLLVWELDLVFTNTPEHAMLLLVEEWRDPHQHLIYEDTKCPPVYCEVMAFSFNYLWCHIFGCPTIRLGHLALLQIFCHSEVSDEDIA